MKLRVCYVGSDPTESGTYGKRPKNPNVMNWNTSLHGHRLLIIAKKIQLPDGIAFTSMLLRYWVNEQFWTGPEGPVFLHLGGEGTLGPGLVMRGHPAALAPALGALVVGLEHRFYGLSVPAGGLDMGQLRFLSSRQALADMASAHLTLSRLFNVSSSGPWICFIGSYAGSLATWARLKIVLHSLEQKCLSTSRAETVAQLRDTDPQVSSMGDRQWLYPTCTEFGFYITCAGPACPFSQLPTLPSQLSLCEQVFGLSISSVSQAVEQTNCYYGGQSPRATHVLFVNGDSDPWHVLSVTQSLGPLESALLIPNASHCLDMAPERASDAPSLRLARQKIFQQLQTWLLQAKESQVKGVSERQALAPSYVATWIMDTSHSTEGSGLL